MSTDEMEISVTRMEVIWADPSFNCRGAIQAIEVMSLVQDIDKNGLMMPVHLSPLTDEQKERAPEGKKFLLIAGYRRHRSFRVLKKDFIPAIIREDMQDEKRARLFNLSENLHRKELNLLQEVAALRPLKEKGMSEADAASELGMSRGWVQIRYMMMALPEEVCKEITAYKLTNKQIRNLYSIHGSGAPDAEQMTVRAIKTMKDGKLKGRSVKVNANHTDTNRPRVRSRSDILQLLDHMTSCGLPISIHNRCLAWCAGQISDGQLHRSFVDYSKEEHYVYHLPSDIHIEDLPELA